ncbi:DUF5666 domain-containing protein [Mycobacterium europaeum]|uniref:DUF5666 domain-containing protein n=1 Tax=Mycobacterium europaeum TaxID=761804 RepID=UPI002ADF94A8|nr:DUF5666 domain-containing protein [Mycobacterium europaeum]MEA1162363.1 DUF5666 domain-containing protein [Mycobacterium europaeum]
MSAGSRTPLFTRVAVVAVAGTTALSIAACGSSNKSSPPSTSTSTVTSTTTSPVPAAGEARVSGLIASVAGNSVQVTQKDNATATVNFTATTKVTEVTPAALTDVTAGNCVTVRPTNEGQGGQPVTAASVKVSPSVNGTCPKPKAAAPGGSPGPAPSGAPTPPPAKPAPVQGSVASVTGNTINVTGTDPSGNTTQTAVTVDDKTRYTKQSSATTDAITQGKCLTARGTKDNSGALQATSINVRAANDGKCAGPAGPPHAHG